VLVLLGSWMCLNRPVLERGACSCFAQAAVLIVYSSNFPSLEWLPASSSLSECKQRAMARLERHISCSILFILLLCIITKYSQINGLIRYAQKVVWILTTNCQDFS
jgi:hypothetical protein